MEKEQTRLQEGAKQPLQRKGRKSRHQTTSTTASLHTHKHLVKQGTRVVVVLWAPRQWAQASRQPRPVGCFLVRRWQAS